MKGAVVPASGSLKADHVGFPVPLLIVSEVRFELVPVTEEVPPKPPKPVLDGCWNVLEVCPNGVLTVFVEVCPKGVEGAKF